jgi:hypothetical protein
MERLKREESKRKQVFQFFCLFHTFMSLFLLFQVYDAIDMFLGKVIFSIINVLNFISMSLLNSFPFFQGVKTLSVTIKIQR